MAMKMPITNNFLFVKLLLPVLMMNFVNYKSKCFSYWWKGVLVVFFKKKSFQLNCKNKIGANDKFSVYLHVFMHKK